MDGKPDVATVIALRTVLWEAVDDRTDQERAALRDRVAAVVADLQRLWADNLSGFRAQLVDELKRIHFQLGKRPQLSEANKPGEQKIYFFCIKCEIPIIVDDSLHAVCPVCSSPEWLEVIFS